MKIEFLIATMNKSEMSFFFKMFEKNNIKEINAIIINQCTLIEPITDIITPHQNIKIFSVKESGLSRSRNLALEKSTGDVCVIADDDFVYESDIVKQLEKVFENDKKTDIFTFRTVAIETGELRKNYRLGSYFHSKYSVSRCSSSDIVFKKSPIVMQGIKFDENFGLGSKYPSGEDNIFLVDCINRGLIAKGNPLIILATPGATTGGKTVFNPILRGKVFRRMYYNLVVFLLVSLYTSISKYKIYKLQHSFFGYYLKLLKGGIF